MNTTIPKSLMCPSADTQMSNSLIFGIVIGTAEVPHLVHLDRVMPVPPELLALDSPVQPTEIFRIAATCSEGACQHFDGTNCRLTQRIVAELPPVTEQIPACAIRASCRWWHQEGKAACLRCQQIVRDNYIASEQLIHAIDPAIYLEQGGGGNKSIRTNKMVAQLPPLSTSPDSM